MKEIRSVIRILLVLVMLGSVVSPVFAVSTKEKENNNNKTSKKPLQYYLGYISTFVRKSNGNEIGSNSHWFYGVSSGVDHYYDPSTWGSYIGGAILGCIGYCSCSTSGSCQVNALKASISRSSKSVKPSDWYGYDTCRYSKVCSNGCGEVYGTVTASCSTIYGCYIDVEWHAMCYDRGI